MTYTYKKTWPPPHPVAHTHSTPRAGALAVGQDLRALQASGLAHAPAGLRSILAITDLGPECDGVLQAAAKLARQHGLPLHLAYHCKTPQHGYLRPIDRLVQRSRFLSRHHQMQVEVRIKRELSEHDLATLASEFELVFIGRDQLLQRNVLGASSLAKGLLDQARVHVVAYKPLLRPEGAQALVATRHESAIASQLSALAQLDADMSVELLHVIHRREFAELDESELNQGVFHHSLRQHWVQLYRRFESAIDAARHASQSQVDLVLAHGDTRAEIAKRLTHRPVSWLVLGWHRRHWLGAWLRDRMVLRLLQDVACPVLLVPLPRASRRGSSHQ